jgi:hypothetical protein
MLLHFKWTRLVFMNPTCLVGRVLLAPATSVLTAFRLKMSTDAIRNYETSTNTIEIRSDMNDSSVSFSSPSKPSDAGNARREYVVFGCTCSQYSFWLPITALIWQRRQLYTPIVFLTEEVQDQANNRNRHAGRKNVKIHVRTCEFSALARR